MATETVTVLFTDLVGSTELLSRVGETAAEGLRREHFGLLRGAVEEHGGREVKNLGDGLMVVFSSAADAVAASVEIQQAFEHRNRDAPEPLSIRVGVALGDADVEDGDYFGVPVVEAARLCAKAEGGEILATVMVRTLARSRTDAVFESMGELELKGLDQPVETLRVGWVPSPSGAARWGHELPARLVSAQAANFVGRDAEHDQLVAEWKAVTEGSTPRIAFVAGEPGIGKSTLAARLAAEIHDDGGLVLYGRCDEDLGIPYQPWVEALTQLVTAAPDELLTAHVADRGAHVARLVPDLARRTGVEVPVAGDGDAERFVVFGCVIDLLERASTELPVFVVLDDLHWTDRPSVQLLRQVMTTDRPVRFGVLATFRDSEVGTDHPLAELLAALHREGDSLRINLQGFSDLDLLHLLEQTAGHEMDENGVALRDAMLAETNGNPFFVVEILRHLAETGAIYQDDTGRWVADADLQAVGLPVSVREVIGRRVNALGSETERVLTYAAVIGRDFDTTLLAGVTELDEDVVIDVCDIAAQAAVLSETDIVGRYTFAHALIEHTLYERLSATRRARAHRAVAEQLEELTAGEPGARVGELAYHWAQVVQPTDNAKAVHYAQLAGDRALNQLAPDEAVRWYSQALELHDRGLDPDPRQRAELLVGLGDAQRQTGVAAHRETLLDAARLAVGNDDTDLLVRAVLANSRGYVSSTGEVDRERIAAIDQALERVGGAPTAERAKLLALAVTERTYLVDLPERQALADEAVAVARASGDRAALAMAYYVPCIAITHPSTVSVRTAWLDEACTIADSLGDLAMQYSAHIQAYHAANERGDGPAIDEHLRRAEALAVRVPHANIRWSLTYEKAFCVGLRGDLVEYERLAEQSLTMGIETGQTDAMTIYSAQLANVRSRAGRFHELIPFMEQALADTPTLQVYRAALALAHAYAGHTDRAKEMIDEDRMGGFPMREDTTWSTGMQCWTEASVRVRALDAAPMLRERILPYHDRFVTTAATFDLALSHSLGTLDHLLGRYDTAEEWFAEALELHERVRSPILVAQTQAAWAALLTDRGHDDDHDRARTMARAGFDAASAGGWGLIEADARAVLERLA